MTSISSESNRTSAKGYAQSITILSSTMHAAPELVMEEDGRDEDGDDDDDDIDDDLSIWTVCSSIPVLINKQFNSIQFISIHIHSYQFISTRKHTVDI